jgi:hypothetical protein
MLLIHLYDPYDTVNGLFELKTFANLFKMLDLLIFHLNIFKIIICALFYYIKVHVFLQLNK